MVSQSFFDFFSLGLVGGSNALQPHNYFRPLDSPSNFLQVGIKVLFWEKTIQLWLLRKRPQKRQCCRPALWQTANSLKVNVIYISLDNNANCDIQPIFK